ncbi:MAG TPA: CHASE2 domain-containing protein [Allocoleopsis sp.]
MFKSKILQDTIKQYSRIIITSLLVTGGVIGVRQLGLLQTLELAAWDQLFNLKPKEQADKRITIITIEENELKELGWPIPDKKLAELLEKINQFNPRVIGLDIYKDIPIEKDKTKDYETFNQTIEKLPNFVAIELLKPDGVQIKAPKGLEGKPENIGFNNVTLDNDGKIRRSLLYWTIEEKTHTSFSLQLALKYLAKEKIQPEASALNPNYMQLNKAVFKKIQSNDGGYANADSGGYQILTNFRPYHSFIKVPYRDVINGKVSTELIRDRIVIIGLNTESVKDSFLTPHNGGIFLDKSGFTYGVEIHAHFVSQIISAALDNRPLIQTWNEPLEYIWILIWSSIGAILAWKLKSSPIKSTISMMIGLIVLSGTAYIMLLYSWWIPVIPPMVSLIISNGVIISYFAQLQEEFKRSKEFLQTMINTIADPIFVMDKHHHYIILNKAYSQLVGASIEDLMNKSDYDIFAKEEADLFLYQNQRVFLSGDLQESEEKFTDKRGNIHIIATKRSLHKDGAGNLFLVGVIRDITERKRIEEELKKAAEELQRSHAELKESEDQMRYLAYHDQLTGLPNRKQFYESLQMGMNKATENNNLLGLLFLDLDGFKQVNDGLGHDIGDILLKVVADRLKAVLRGSDIVCRLAGDEFTVILPKISKEQDAAKVAEKILFTLAEPFILEGNIVHITGSIGISIYPLDGLEMDLLIKNADSAMYVAKQAGKNRIELYSS